MAHPECTKSVRDIADYIGSTVQILVYAAKCKSKEFIVRTEDGLIHTLQKANPDKKFYPVTTCCRGMKRIDLEKVVASLEGMKFKIDVTKNIRAKAKRALERMLVCK